MARSRLDLLRTAFSICVVAVALVAALAPIPPHLVERFYSRGFYVWLERPLTTFSNRAPFALFDVLVPLVFAAVTGWWLFHLRKVHSGGRFRTVVRLSGETLVVAAAIYLVFLSAWGLNYRRVPLKMKLDFEESRVNRDTLASLTRVSVQQLNDLYEADTRWPTFDDMAHLMDTAFKRTQQQLSSGPAAVPGRPKRSMLRFFFERSAVDGMTNPFLLEILVNTGVLPFERPFVVVHEWAHLAGYADESEANFVGWLTCLNGDRHTQYSAWLFLYPYLVEDLPPEQRTEIVRTLADGPRRDLRATADRLRRATPLVRRSTREIYDKFLKANRVAAGVASYDNVVELILGTRFLERWRPAVKPSS